MKADPRFTVTWRGTVVGRFTAEELSEKIHDRALSAYHQIETESGPVSVRAWMESRRRAAREPASAPASPAPAGEGAGPTSLPPPLPTQAHHEPTHLSSLDRRKKPAGLGTVLVLLVIGFILYAQYHDTKSTSQWTAAQAAWLEYADFKNQIAKANPQEMPRLVASLRALATRDLPQDLRDSINARAELLEEALRLLAASANANEGQSRILRENLAELERRAERLTETEKGIAVKLGLEPTP